MTFNDYIDAAQPLVRIASAASCQEERATAVLCPSTPFLALFEEVR